jgi:acyl-CoA synthetase (AMP-forming)/AMP-acid ligase II
MQNIIEWLEDHSLPKNALCKFSTEDDSVSVTELHNDSQFYAAELHRLGIKSGDKVGLFFDNSPCYLTVLLAIWRLNAIAVPLTPKNLRQCRYAREYAVTDQGCRIKLLIHSVATSEDVLIEWMRLCNGLAINLEHFKNLAPQAGRHIIINHFKSNQPDDIAVYKIPHHAGSTMNDCLLTHRMIWQWVASTHHDSCEPGTLTLSSMVANLLSLVSLPLVAGTCA